MRSDSSSPPRDVPIGDPLDVRDQPRAERRDRVFDRLERADPGDTLSISADTDVRPSLAQYRIERGTALEWTLERDGPETREIDVTRRAEPAAERPEFHWEYRAKDPGEFRVLIGKTDTDGETASTATNTRSDAAANDDPQAPF